MAIPRDPDRGDGKLSYACHFMSDLYISSPSMPPIPGCGGQWCNQVIMVSMSSHLIHQKLQMKSSMCLLYSIPHYYHPNLRRQGFIRTKSTTILSFCSTPASSNHQPFISVANKSTMYPIYPIYPSIIYLVKYKPNHITSLLKTLQWFPIDPRIKPKLAWVALDPLSIRSCSLLPSAPYTLGTPSSSLLREHMQIHSLLTALVLACPSCNVASL